MATFTYKDKRIYYEDTGQGEPLLLLNGIMMSTKSWEPFIKNLNHLTRLIRLDFVDQGQSEKMSSTYTQAFQAELTLALLDHLHIEKVHLAGISYGGQVALIFATLYENRLSSLMLFNTSAYTSSWLKDIGRHWILTGQSKNGLAYYQATIPVIYSQTFYETHLDWMNKRKELLIPLFENKVFLASMERLIHSAESFDVRPSIHKITVPTLIVAADQDYLTPLANQKALKSYMNHAHLVILPNIGHASMYEAPELFISLVLGFVLQKDKNYQI